MASLSTILVIWQIFKIENNMKLRLKLLLLNDYSFINIKFIERRLEQFGVYMLSNISFSCHKTCPLKIVIYEHL